MNGAQTATPSQDAEGRKRLAPYLTAAQVGELLQLSAKSIYRLAADDPTMPMLKLGGTIRFPRERLERWLRDREQGPRIRRQVLPVSNPASEQEAKCV